ncbi:hypothetical protein TASIC1_0012029300 [Trichoderma asperellum]|uniref:Peptidase S8/S53 domain-containing protein n=1 Tax=Trichoderma asperellum TaxID=101201 RepID=A0A6V8R402_TRIAP|nr:hypothetical protein TASIC1_0012029300 [Trichoderma asperellum]
MSQTNSKSNQPKRQGRPQNGQNKSGRGNVNTKKQESQKDNGRKHEEIVNALKNSEPINLNDYEDLLLKTDTYGWNLLHRIIFSLKAADKTQYSPASEEILAFVERLVVDEPKLLIQENVHDSIPLLDASNSKLEIVFRVINLVVPDAVLASLETPCSEQDQKCPLESVNEFLLEKCRRDESKKPSAAVNLEIQDEEDEQKRCEHEKIVTIKSDNATSASRDSRRVCLHAEINVPKLKEKNDDIKKALSDGLARQKKPRGTCLQSLIIATNFDPSVYPDKGVPIIPRESFRLLLQLCPSNIFDSAAQDGFSPLQMAIRLYAESKVDYQHLFLVIQELVERSPSSIYFEAGSEAENDAGKTAYRLLKELDMKVDGNAEAVHEGDSDYSNDHGHASHWDHDRADNGDHHDYDYSSNSDNRDHNYDDYDDDDDEDSYYGDDDNDNDEERVINETNSGQIAGSYSNDRNNRQRSYEKTEELLKRVCIGVPNAERALEDKLKFLYWGDAERVRKISLNLLGESKRLDDSYIAKAKKLSGMLFETILASVQLPYWNPQASHSEKQYMSEEQVEPAESVTPQASNPYIGIFEWLWESNVRKIFSVEVDDTGPEPHSNAAIRQSLCFQRLDGIYQDFQIEIFKWKKYDICSETVYEAAPNAKEVYLYSLGNTAVLRGWACSSGLHKMKHLEHLVIEIYPKNTNDEADCKAYEKKMKLKLVENCPRLNFSNIKVEYPKSMSGHRNGSEGDANPQRGNNDNNSPVNNTPTPDEWIRQMKPFKQFVVNMANSIDADKNPTVKVAVLDDGVSLDSLGLNGAKGLNGGKGQSFRRDNGEYWLCPMAQLYIARLDDCDEKQKFTTESCFKALEWARKMEVDIISMSWSFKKKDGSADEGGKNFANELNAAVEANNVIMFTSLPDKGATAEIIKYLPVGNEKVIRIGSATMFGEEAKEIIFADRDFLLPGEEIQIPGGESDKGSSFATAYAAGLGALVLYCLRAHKALEDSYSEKNDPLGSGYDYRRTAERLKEAATTGGIRKIFKVLSGQNAKDEIPKKGFFVRPYLALDNTFGTTKQDKILYLRNLGHKILPLD